MNISTVFYLSLLLVSMSGCGVPEENSSAKTPDDNLEQVGPPLAAPSFVDFSPSSPNASSVAPNVMGLLSETGEGVNLYSDSSCTTLVASGTKEIFESSGISISVEADSTTPLYAESVNTDLKSSCVFLASYTHDTIAPVLSSLTLSGGSDSGGTVSRSVVWGSLSESISESCYRFSTTPGSETIDTCSWSEAETLPTTLEGSLSSAGVYSVVVWVKDAAGNVSSPLISVNSLNIDLTAPTWSDTLVVPDYSTDQTSLSAAVSVSLDASDSGSGLDKYQYAVGTGQASASTACAASCADRKDWTDLSSSPFTPTGLSSLTHGQTYFVNIRALDSAGNYRVYSKSFVADLEDPVAPTIVSVSENQSVSVIAASTTTWTGTCDSSSGNVLNVSPGSNVVVLSSSCVDGALTLNLRMSGLNFSTPVSRSVSLTSTKPSGRVSSSSLRTVSATGICPSNYVRVSGNSLYSTSDFCVAKFEMKAVTSNPTGGSASLANSGNGNITVFDASLWPDSRPDGTPFVRIQQRQAIQMCDRLNSGTASDGSGPYQLLSNAQWQTLASNITSVASNWSGGSIGNGKLARGHSDNALLDPYVGSSQGLSWSSTAALAASSVDLSTVDWPWTSSPDPDAELAAGYRGTGNNATQSMDAGYEQRRTNALSSGDIVWDVGGNVWEYVRYTQTDGAIDSGLTTPSGATNSADNYNSRYIPAQSSSIVGTNWYELSNPLFFGSAYDCPILGASSPCTGTGSLNAFWFQPSGSFWGDSTNLYPSDFNLGRVYALDGESGSTRIPLRGGPWNDLSNSGIFSAALNINSSVAANSRGFRCAIRP